MFVAEIIHSNDSSVLKQITKKQIKETFYQMTPGIKDFLKGGVGVIPLSYLSQR